LRRKEILRHHRESLARAVAKLRGDGRVLAVIVAGSLAHGYARRHSDIDLMIVVSDREYRKRLRNGAMGYWETESITYKGGYVDGKYTSPAFLRKVAARGSEPARYAFRDAWVAFARIRGISGILRRIVRYPDAERESKTLRFLAQIEAWKWYFYEALKHRNDYLRNVAVGKIILFGCRLILVRNRVLYPYHKWLLREIERQKRRPRGVLELVGKMLTRADPAAVERFHALVKRYAGVRKPDRFWANRFMLDSELNWLDGDPPVDDL
jgi:predicted nucleotidyltransferase